MIEVQEHIPLQQFSTIEIGGIADFFCLCKSEQDILDALDYAQENNLNFFVLGEGSNTLFSDKGFRGLIIKIDLKGISIDSSDPSLIAAKAGEKWDTFVQAAIHHNLTGVECLSGIPGLVGAAPIQNIGAYGQEVSQTIEKLAVINCQTRQKETILAGSCDFSYRHSRFKGADKGKYIITEVFFKLSHDKEPKILYQELFRYVKSRLRYKTLLNNQARLEALREAVLDIRKSKSMLIDKNDPNSRSLGSFFLNPVVPKAQCQSLLETYPDMPYFNFGSQVKLSAAWLLEQTGYKKGYIHKHVGTSENHCLAIINRKGGTQREVLELADLMVAGVKQKFAIVLAPEPNIL